MIICFWIFWLFSNVVHHTLFRKPILILNVCSDIFIVCSQLSHFHEADYSRSAADDFNNKKSQRRRKNEMKWEFRKNNISYWDVDELYPYMQHDEYMSHSPLYLKTKLPVRRGRKVLSYSQTKWLSIIICTAIVVNGNNNFVAIIASYFRPNSLHDAKWFWRMSHSVLTLTIYMESVFAISAIFCRQWISIWKFN